MSELWEIVRADELNEGDTFRYGAFTKPHLIESIHKNRVAVHVNETHRLASVATVFRRIPDAEDPRVLRRAILLMERSWLQRMGLRNTKYYIEKARKELGSEGSNDQA